MRKNKPVDDWTNVKGFSKETRLPEPTVKYLCRKDIRESTGFEECIRYLTPRIKQLSPSRYWIWVEKKACADRGAA